MGTQDPKTTSNHRTPESLANLNSGTITRTADMYDSTRPVQYRGLAQAARISLFALWFFSCICSLALTQYIGAPLYFINQNYFYAFMALTKRSFGLWVVSMSQWFSPTTMRISGDKSVRGQLSRTKDGRLRADFPERLVMIANHQLYSDWVYLWWMAYANKMHGHVYIILKESLQYIPILGQGMMFFGFVFMARNWARDKPRLQHRLRKLKSRHQGPLSGSQSLDPMWLMIFPEGTNVSANGRKGSKKWADKQGLQDLEHQLLPRSTGLLFCLQELKGTVDWVYDCTIGYEGVPPGMYGQDYYTLHANYFAGRPPKSVNLYWRRFALSSIPLDNSQEFELWLRQCWLEKEELLKGFVQNGCFPADESNGVVDGVSENVGKGGAIKHGTGFIETDVKLRHWYEIGQIFVILLSVALIANISAKVWNMIFYGTLVGRG